MLLQFTFLYTRKKSVQAISYNNNQLALAKIWIVLNKYEHTVKIGKCWSFASFQMMFSNAFFNNNANTRTIRVALAKEK